MYGTIVVTSVLVVYDGWANLKRLDAIVIILGPVIAMVIGHIFAASLSGEAARRRRPTMRALARTVRHESRFVLVAVPQIVLLFVLTLAGVSMNDTIHVLIWVGVASLGLWGGVAAQGAGLGGSGIALGVIVGLAVGLVVLLLQVFLQPGKAASGGVAVIRLGLGLVG